MAVKKNWTVTHSCGHEVDHDLSERPADKRASFARWLEGRACRACWLAEKSGDEAERAEWLKNKRAEEQQAAAEWAEQYRMPPLDGPAKAVPWGERCRHLLVTGAYRVLVVEGSLDEGDWQQLEDQARTVDRASWWIDQREASPTDLPELLAAAVNDADARTSENPY
ncbi:hypothetical protein P3T36_003343 [Kitasatospora sp. MAP12-15]|uniref:hypothetical protein n=1 Tax=unclassified Kitasatospora TaxID=2633591 RepID=UPI002475625C|nr:hypothetical protein [Kitasatospora sp. MAP12-44]MDH6111319.1 hypothetical protein [Kitasatospora sp. MAP12-44]